MEPDEVGQVAARVVRRCQRAGMSRADAEDCVHDAVLALLTRHRDADAGEPETLRSVEAWLVTVARRKMIDGLRRARNEQGALARLCTATPPQTDPGQAVVERALATWLVEALRQLPDVTQQVCRSVAAGVSVEETATRLGLSRRSVESHLTRARRLLRHLVVGAAAVVTGTIALLSRHTTAAAATAPVALTAAAIGVTLLPHHTPMPYPALPPPVAIHAPAFTSPPPPSAPDSPPNPVSSLSPEQQHHPTDLRPADSIAPGTAQGTNEPDVADSASPQPGPGLSSTVTPVEPAPLARTDTDSSTTTPTDAPVAVSAPRSSTGTAPSATFRDLPHVSPTSAEHAGTDHDKPGLPPPGRDNAPAHPCQDPAQPAEKCCDTAEPRRSGPRGGRAFDAAFDDRGTEMPLNRFGTACGVVPAVLSATGDLASFVTVGVVAVDGGVPIR